MTFLARGHKLLKHEHGVRFVVSYSEAHQNGMVVVPKPRSTPWQSGGMNFIHLGKVRPEHHYQIADGRIRTLTGAIPMDEATNCERQADDDEAGSAPTWTDAVVAPPKERWFLDLSPTQDRQHHRNRDDDQRSEEKRFATRHTPHGTPVCVDGLRWTVTPRTAHDQRRLIPQGQATQNPPRSKASKAVQSPHRPMSSWQTT